MYTNVRNDAVFEYENEYYDYETLRKVDLKNPYSIYLNDDEDFETQTRNHKSSMNKLVSILNKHGIDDEVVKRAKFDPRNVMVSFLGHMFKNFKAHSWDEQLEDFYMENVYKGALTGYIEGQFDEEHIKYDINGYYLHLLKTLTIPMGDAERIPEDYVLSSDDIGIFEIEIKSKLPYYYSKQKTVFTTYDLYLFEKIDVKYKIISGIVYKSYIKCNDIKSFDKILDELYEKRDKVLKECFKKWDGSLSQLNTMTTDTIREGDIIVNKKDTKYSVVKACYKHKYKTPLFRVKAFITSYGRLILGLKIHTLEQKGHKVIRVQTDSIVTTQIKDLNIGTSLGQWKIENTYRNFQNTKIDLYGEY
jgi:hypothetical protein